MEKTRTSNSIVNSMTSITTQILTVVMDFVVKTIFIYVLGNEYLGVNGLFSNIITLLSLADLGIGIAIPYSLYKPLANKDENKIKALMNFYKKIYTIIGIIVLVIGLSLTPFLDLFIKERPNIPHLELIYILFASHSALSYFFVYKRFLIESDQKGYIISKITFACSIGLNIVRVILLLLTKNYILFLFCSIIFVIIQNIWYSKKANQLYPYIKDKNNEKITSEDKKEIMKNIKALFIYKIGNVAMNGTDNIIISKWIGLITVGIYSNYLLIINSLNNIVSQLFNSITSSIGNLVVTNNNRSKNIYEKLNFFNFYIYSLCALCLYVLINPFINIWIGEGYLLNNYSAILLSISFYIAGMHAVTNSFRTAYGLFWIAKYRPLIMISLNIIISIILVKPLGVSGVIIGTITSRLLTTAWLDPYIVYVHGFKEKPWAYYIKYIYYFIIFLVSSITIKYLVDLVKITNIFIWILMAILTFITYNIIIVILFYKKEEFKYFYDKLIFILKNIIKKINRV